MPTINEIGEKLRLSRLQTLFTAFLCRVKYFSSPCGYMAALPGWGTSSRLPCHGTKSKDETRSKKAGHHSNRTSIEARAESAAAGSQHCRHHAGFLSFLYGMGGKLGEGMCRRQ